MPGVCDPVDGAFDERYRSAVGPGELTSCLFDANAFQRRMRAAAVRARPLCWVGIARTRLRVGVTHLIHRHAQHRRGVLFVRVIRVAFVAHFDAQLLHQPLGLLQRESTLHLF